MQYICYCIQLRELSDQYERITHKDAISPDQGTTAWKKLAKISSSFGMSRLMMTVYSLQTFEGDDERISKEFWEEAKRISRIRHENIALFMGACTSPGHLALVTG